MIKIKDKKIIVLVVILIVFTIGYFTVVNKVSHAFETDVDYNTIKNQKLELIEKVAKKYGEDNIDKFNEEGLIYIDINTLIESGYLIVSTEGKVLNIEEIKEDLNDKKIRIKNEEGVIKAEIYN